MSWSAGMNRRAGASLGRIEPASSLHRPASMPSAPSDFGRPTCRSSPSSPAYGRAGGEDGVRRRHRRHPRAAVKGMSVSNLSPSPSLRPDPRAARLPTAPPRSHHPIEPPPRVVHLRTKPEASTPDAASPSTRNRGTAPVTPARLLVPLTMAPPLPSRPGRPAMGHPQCPSRARARRPPRRSSQPCHASALPLANLIYSWLRMIWSREANSGWLVSLQHQHQIRWLWPRSSSAPPPKRSWRTRSSSPLERLW
ncbi:hypothetical protein PVAP13_2NG288800 [Panicum virgatum]|uniref:Uncharacterized protein n=1 Tax=Panicum virgatum TaxID=38727 RepID=A0A8T0VDZ8_PANVG|nr:hypothetical protein PVAP13_2NG288800 [Panicum virgatum]